MNPATDEAESLKSLIAITLTLSLAVDSEKLVGRQELDFGSSSGVPAFPVDSSALSSAAFAAHRSKL